MTAGSTGSSTQDLVWEQHCCLPLVASADVGELGRYVRPGGAYVSVNVGYTPHRTADVLGLLTAFRRGIGADARFVLANTLQDVDDVRASGRVAIAFDLEDANPLEGQLDRLAEFYRLGVRTLLPTYNHRNAAGCGCLDTHDTGLSPYGRDLVHAMNEIGMIVDGSHCSTRTGLDLAEVTRTPMIYSHVCMRAVWEHERNITDEQARACAETGGVIGITGVGIFLGPNDASMEALCRHIDYAVELVGPEHVGVSSDYPFDAEDLRREFALNPHLFPEAYTRWGPIEFMPPEEFLGVGDALRSRGYPSETVAGIIGGNFRRVAEQVWA